MNYTLSCIIIALLKLAASPEDHKNLNPLQAELLTNLGDVDKTTVTNFSTLLGKLLASRSGKLFVYLYLKKGGRLKIKKDKFRRVGIVTFPYYEEVNKGAVEFSRKKDKLVFEKMMKFIFPDIDEDEAYNYGSDCSEAPYLDALLKTSSNITSRCNELLSIYKDYISDYESLKFDMGWYIAFEDLSVLKNDIRSIPVQFTNNGTAIVGDQLIPQLETRENQQTMFNNKPNIVPVKEQSIITENGLDYGAFLERERTQQPFQQFPQNQLQPIYQQVQQQFPTNQSQPLYPQSQPIYQQYPQYQSQPIYPQSQQQSPQGIPYLDNTQYGRGLV